MEEITPRRRMRASRSVYVRRRMVFFSLMIVIPLLALAGWRGYQFWHSPLTPQSSAAPAPTSLRKFTVLIMGADDRPNEPGRSDTMMLGFVDLDSGGVKLLSVPRDSYAQIPGHGWDKINAAYAFGKEDLAKKSLENVIGMPIDYYVVVDMQGFAKIVDRVGGVDINIEAAMDYEDPYDKPPLSIHFKKGPAHLGGADALRYVRFRHDIESDWGRMKRQQLFLKALVQAAKQPSSIAKLPSLVSDVVHNVRTNLSPAQILQMANAGKDTISAGGLSGQSLAGEDLWTVEGYYLGLNLTDVRKTVRDLAGKQPTAADLEQDRLDQAAYQAALPEAVSTATTTTPTPPTPPPQGGTDTGAKTGSTTPAAPGQGTSGSGSKSGPSGGATGAGSGGKTGGTQTTGWPLVVMDGSAGAQSALLEKLRGQGFQVTAFRTSGVDATTIVWYSAPPQAVDKLKALVPSARVIHMTPSPGDPQLKLLLAPR